MAVQTTSTTAQNLTSRQAKFTHPTFVVLQPIWQKLRDVREGTGGFLDGTYLIAHPREWKDYDQTSPRVPTQKLKARRQLASYENFASTILEALKTALFREQPVRRVGDDPKADAPPTPIEEWWENVDGAGTHIDDFLAMVWDIAGTFGHVFLYMDRAPSPDAPTAADVPMPFLRVYTPLDVWDWVVDDLGNLQEIKFAELAPRTTIEQAYRPEVRVRVVTAQSWTLYDAKGTRMDSGDHQMGVLPVVALFAQRRPLEPHVGQSVLGDPNLYIDLYNLVSEVRELLRNQTFGILNVPLGTGEGSMTVTEAQTMMGQAVGTENVLFSGTAAGFISPDAANVTVYHAEISRKLRTIYRLVSLAWEADSKDAEAEGSLQLKREDMNQRLSGYADELEKADYALAELFYRSMDGERGAEKVEEDEVQIKYPDTFDMTPFEQVLEQAEAAMSLGMPALFLKELRKRLARKFDGMADLPNATLEAIDEAIDAAPDDLTPAEQAQQRLDLTMQAMQAGGTKEPKPPKSPMGEAA